MLSKVDRILTKGLTVEKGCGAQKVIAEFLKKTGQLLPSIACCDLRHFATASVGYRWWIRDFNDLN